MDGVVSSTAGGSVISYDVSASLVTVFEQEASDGSFFDHLAPEMADQFVRFCAFPDVVDRHNSLRYQADGMHSALVRTRQLRTDTIAYHMLPLPSVCDWGVPT